MICRKATAADINAVLELQSKYLFANMSEEERAFGFVTTPFTFVQINEIIELDGLFVAAQNTDIVAYAFAASWDYFSQWPIFPFMVNRLPLLDYREVGLTADNSFQYGPICIASAYRGTGLLQELFETMRIAMSDRYPYGVTFINQVNEISFHAHTSKLGMTWIDSFPFNGNQYYGLAFMTNESVL